MNDERTCRQLHNFWHHAVSLILALGLLTGCSSTAPLTYTASSTATQFIPPPTTPIMPLVTPTTGSPVRGTAVATSAPSSAEATVIARSIATSCEREAVAAFFRRFLDTFNEGEKDQLARFFPEQAVTNPRSVTSGEERLFRWFTVGRREGEKVQLEFAAYNRADLLLYLARRMEQHERLDLRHLEVGEISWDGGVGVGFELLRQANDLPAYAAVGKASIDCANGTIYVWSLGPAN